VPLAAHFGCAGSPLATAAWQIRFASRSRSCRDAAARCGVVLWVAVFLTDDSRGSAPVSGGAPADRAAAVSGTLTKACSWSGREGRLGWCAGVSRLSVVDCTCWRVIFRTSRPMARPANAQIGLVAAVRRSARITGWPGAGWMWPMFPATLTPRPIRAVAHGQIRCRAGQPSS
jgi:hypothetical protein